MKAWLTEAYTLTLLLNILISAAMFLFVLSVLVFIHELGHYSVARAFGMAVERFSIGFGRPIKRWTAKSGTEWQIASIPLGGYVKFAGDAGAASNPDSEALERIRAEEAQSGRSIDDIFHFRPIWQRSLVVLAGPVANFLLAIVLFAIAAMWAGTQHIPAVIGEVEPDSPAAAAGLMPGDKILTMDGKDTSDWQVMAQHIQLRSETPIVTVVEREGREIEMTLQPRRIDDKDFIGGRMQRGQVGIRADRTVEIETRTYGPIAALAFGTEQTGNTLGATFHYIGRIFTLREDGKQLGSIGRIAAVTGKSTYDVTTAEVPFSQKMRALALRTLQLGAAISIALGFANLMPIPMLDGGHLAFYGYEAVAGRPLSQKKQEFAFRTGMALLLTLFLVLTFNDIGYINSLRG